eukprot:CAMPEP_0171984984 /NCGR_PEP_ID=MMETSP0993-20121228/274108_1 /TAXON_ID=483369 /ORGANISM="non described non described, Strain CCMP2098" /LENGTH=925 /DNA_ID=CAMNT_0012637825 /DNA_START=94 /DNA_END=2875 /DNA_ORIENTATION=+
MVSLRGICIIVFSLSGCSSFRTVFFRTRLITPNAGSQCVGPRPSTTHPYVPFSKDVKTLSLSRDEIELFHVLNDVASKDGTTLRIAGGWVRDRLLRDQAMGVSLEGGLDSRGSLSREQANIRDPSIDIDIALDDQLGSEFATKVFAWLEEHGEEAAHGVGTIMKNPEKSKHLETATMSFRGFSIDFVNLRTEEYSDGSSRIPSRMDIGTATEDALRRDLTINSLFYNLRTGEVEDLTTQGLSHLACGLVATPLAPMLTLLDDPLRLLRAIRFASRFGFELDEALLVAAKSKEVKAALASKVSRERIGHEFDLMLSNKGSSAMGHGGGGGDARRVQQGMRGPVRAMRVLHALNVAPTVLLEPTTLYALSNQNDDDEQADLGKGGVGLCVVQCNGTASQRCGVALHAVECADALLAGSRHDLLRHTLGLGVQRSAAKSRPHSVVGGGDDASPPPPPSSSPSLVDEKKAAALLDLFAKGALAPSSLEPDAERRLVLLGCSAKSRPHSVVGGGDAASPPPSPSSLVDEKKAAAPLDLFAKGALAPSGLEADAERRLVLLGCLLLPWADLLVSKAELKASLNNKPFGGSADVAAAAAAAVKVVDTVPALRFLASEGLKLKGRDSNALLVIHDSARKFRKLLGSNSRSGDDGQRLSRRAEAGLALRAAGPLWRAALLVAIVRETISVVAVGDERDQALAQSAAALLPLRKQHALLVEVANRGVSPMANELSAAVTREMQASALFAALAKWMDDEGLLGSTIKHPDKAAAPALAAWQMAPLFNGDEVARILPNLPKGPLVREVMDALMRWQFSHRDVFASVVELQQARREGGPGAPRGNPDHEETPTSTLQAESDESATSDLATTAVERRAIGFLQETFPKFRGDELWCAGARHLLALPPLNSDAQGPDGHNCTWLLERILQKDKRGGLAIF